MSRQATIQTDIECKNADVLEEALQIVCSEMKGTVIRSVRYSSAKLGISIGGIQIGIEVGADGKLRLTGDEDYLHRDKTLLNRVQALLKKNYISVSLERVVKKAGYRTTISRGVVNRIVGVKA